jgi:hypothetical protein
MARRKSGVLCDPMDRPDAVSDVADCDPKKPNRRADAAQRRRFFEPAGVGSDRDEPGDTQRRRPARRAGGRRAAFFHRADRLLGLTAFVTALQPFRPEELR